MPSPSASLASPARLPFSHLLACLTSKDVHRRCTSNQTGWTGARMNGPRPMPWAVTSLSSRPPSTSTRPMNSSSSSQDNQEIHTSSSKCLTHIFYHSIRALRAASNYTRPAPCLGVVHTFRSERGSQFVDHVWWLTRYLPTGLSQTLNIISPLLQVRMETLPSLLFQAHLSRTLPFLPVTRGG